MALTISQASSGHGDVFTLAYSTDTSAATFFGDDVYTVPDTAMLLQAVDTIQLLHDTTSTSDLDDMNALGEFTLTDSSDDVSSLTQNFTPSRQLQAVLNSPLPESLAEFSTLHSKDYVLYDCTRNIDDSPATQTSNSPLPSPIAYPTPPASHETVAQASPFLDESHHFSDGGNSFFDDHKRTSFLDDSSVQFFKTEIKCEDLTDNEKILKLKHELFNETSNVMMDNNSFSRNSLFQTKIESPDDNYSHQNLTFLDESQNFLDDARNTSSPLSAAFFTATMSSAEEVKEALEEVLPNENLHGEDTDDNDIDLYYLPALSLQSQMMPNSDDPLLSSSPKDFIHKAQLQKFDFAIFCPPNAKKIKLSDDIVINNNNNNNKIPLTIHTEQIPKDSEVFLSPSSISSNLISIQSPKEQGAKNILRKRHNKYNQKFKSIIRSNNNLYYTPSPILNPERYAPGLYSLQNEFSSDFTTLPTITEEKPKINIGHEFQAILPNLIKHRTDFKICEEQFWDPAIITNSHSLKRYVDLSKSSAVPLGSHSEEIALKTLFEAQGEIHVAIMGLLQAPSTSSHQKWNSDEMEIFLRGLEACGKDFYRISQEVSLVFFLIYIWLSAV